MNATLSPALDILYGAEAARLEGFQRVSGVLSIDSQTPIAVLLGANERQLPQKHFIRLLERTAALFDSYEVHRNITDWPFENFWENPHEPKHSKLLSYFISPDEKHGCGLLLLQELFATIAPQLELESDSQCEVKCENGYIDILILRKSKDGREFAVIIENKVNGAPNRGKQVVTYVDRVHRLEKIPYPRIFAFYLPLTNDPSSDPQDRIRIGEDRQAVTACGAHWFGITFEAHIVSWVSKVLIERLANIPPGLADNLNHYRDLIKHRINKRREQNMNAQILEELEKADAKKELPTRLQVRNLIESAEELQKCLGTVLQGKLLFQVQKFLAENKVESVWICGGEPDVEQIINTPFDARFESEVNLCVPVTESVFVCFGGEYNAPSEIFWFGYLRNGKSKDTDTIKGTVLQEVRSHLLNVTEYNAPWYAWVYDKQINYDNCSVDATAQRVAAKLIEMRSSLRKLLRVR